MPQVERPRGLQETVSSGGQTDNQLVEANTTVLSVPGSYYFKPGSSEIRPEILEKERQIRQGHY